MSNLRVWAPKPSKVEVRTSGATMPMQRDSAGWWRAEVGPGDYSFILDGGNPLPDPRSPWQPSGVHSASRTVDHSAFKWTDQQWQARPLSSAVIYELHIGTFTPEGTFDAAIQRLDHLKSLGVTHVELMPVQEFSGDWGWGYDGVDLFAPHHAYGGPEGLKRLVDACHANGLAVLLDVVYNHLGPVGNCLNQFAPYFTVTYHTPWGPAVNLDGPDSTEVRRFLCDNALMWLRDYHIDGLRIDAIHAIHDSSAIHFLEQLASEVDELEAQTGRNLVLIAESDLNDPRIVTPREANGYGIDAQWSDDFHHALHTVLTGERAGYYADFGSLTDLAKALTNVFVYDGRYSCFRRRMHGRPVQGLSAHRFLGYLQNHDQVGNRAKGERSSALMSPARLKIAAALVLCSPFVPMIFQGEEFAASTPFQYFTDHQDPDVARAVSQGRRNEFAAFGWNPADIPDPQDPATFLRSKLDWNESQSRMLDWYRNLIDLRQKLPDLAGGRLDRVSVRFDEQDQWIAIQRGAIHLICNLSKSRRTIPTASHLETLLSSNNDHKSSDNAVGLPPESVLIAQELFA
jgi:maltooligosyltrehalose trehalohydrolase